MQYILTPEQMTDLDAYMINTQGIPGILLMEHAAQGVKQEVLNLLKPGERVGILCGGGNNGGDGMALLRLLSMEDIPAWAAFLAQPDQISGDAKTQYVMAKAMGLTIIPVQNKKDMAALPLKETGILVDALFGTGLSRQLTGIYSQIVEMANKSGKQLVAVDIPSGVDGKDGRVMGNAIQAAVTVTFEHKKIGHMLFPGRSYCGQVRVFPLGRPDVIAYTAEELEEEDVRALLPPRPKNSHKGKNGKALLIAGSEDYAGAALLCGLSALRAGVGLMHAAVPQAIHGHFKKCPEIICHPVGEDGFWSARAVVEALSFMAHADVMAIGPGMGYKEEYIENLSFLINEAIQTKKPVVLDADALNILSVERQLLKELHTNVILTPHPGELGRLLHADANEVSDAPLRYAREAADTFGCTVLLKGATSVIVNEKRVCLNTTGNAGLAKGGSGDVLTGLIAALLAQKLPPYQAACVGAYLLGVSAQKAYVLLSERMLMPADVVDAFTHMIN